VGALVVSCLVLLAADPATGGPVDAYIEGYAAAVLEREFGLTPPSLEVKDGVIAVQAADVAGADRPRLIAALRQIRGVRAVDVREPAAAPPPGPGRRPEAGDEDRPTGVLPGGELFRALIADPRWPRFSAAHQYYVNDPDFANVASVSFGETLVFYRGRLGDGWWETGVQAGVFAIFDLDADSFDLINADYLAALFLAYRAGDVSALGRLLHQSSHLGDEFLLRGSRIDRVNLSYEAADLRLSWEPGLGVRVYGGGGRLLHREPSDLEPWWVQHGVELRSPWPQGGTIRPLAGADFQYREENAWAPDISIRAGVQFDGSPRTRNLQLLLEYFTGHSPNGQFYRRAIDYFGLGVHFHF
jgi:hypothetical protein